MKYLTVSQVYIQKVLNPQMNLLNASDGEILETERQKDYWRLILIEKRGRNFK